jgi:hypothetical protein
MAATCGLTGAFVIPLSLQKAKHGYCKEILAYDLAIASAFKMLRVLLK